MVAEPRLTDHGAKGFNQFDKGVVVLLGGGLGAEDD